mmetsp:Transcript_12366/g.14675  ORF Transcript_12366/g.14675 Transcript_12366/m.14675 type:complete len:136 (-) Transcript_12366:219-626(-)
MCEPMFYKRLTQGWSDLQQSGATEVSLLNRSSELNQFKISLVSFSNHINGYMDRVVDIRSRNALRHTNGVEYRYSCRWPYKDFIETSTRFLLRVETDLKLNLAMTDKSLIDLADEEAVRSPEVHFIMFEGQTNRH